MKLFVLTPPGHPDPALAIAACRAGAVGVFNAETGTAAQALAGAVDRLASLGRGPFGIKLGTEQHNLFSRLREWQDKGLQWLVLDAEAILPGLSHRSLQAFRKRGGQLVLEVRAWSGELRDHEALYDGLWAKGHESGGLVGEECGFVLLQRLLANTAMPVSLRGGVGVHTAAACAVAGAAGVVLDNQVLLLRESPVARPLSPLLQGLSGNECNLFGDEEQGRYLRLLERPGFTALQRLKDDLDAGRLEATVGTLNARLQAELAWERPASGLLPLGQDVALAAPYARRFGRLSRLLKAIERVVAASPRQALEDGALGENSPLARELGCRYPIVQGAMTRVSDVPAFAGAVAEAGAVPMIALAMLRGSRARPLLEQTRELLAERPWGVGILGFVDRGLREEQMAAIREVQPPLAYIAGGRPDQARELEEAGIPTFLHAPTPALLRLFLEQGARRFIVEGRECGGHIGPLSSYVLWEGAVDALLEFAGSGGDLAEVSLLFAGGIHDPRSAAMIATLAAPLTAAGAKVGVLMGTAYLFTREAVEHGAILENFQRVALSCDGTASITTGAGHVSRCARTPFVGSFHQRKRELLRLSGNTKETSAELDALTLGKLRVAAKGIVREGSELRPVDGAEQLGQGMYMIGQVAALHDRPTTLDALHQSVSGEAMAWLEQRASAEAAGERPAGRPVDVAVVGLGALLPKANGTREYWQNIIDRLDCITEIPPERWDWRLYFDADRQTPDKIYSKWGGFLDDIPFDPTRYGMPPLSLRSIDPLQLLTLEVVRQAMDDAALDGSVDRERISIILGASGGMGEIGLQYGTRSDLPRVVGPVADDTLQRLPEWTEDSFAGLLLNVAAGRAANRFDFGGVNSTVDAACASSLAAVYQGVSELVRGKSDVVIAGGADTMQSPFAYLCFAKTQALSPTGRCRTFDESADGIVIAEGLAAVVLKRLEDAERDGDRIYAVIKGAGGSSDGRAKGLTAPRPEGQLRALMRAYDEAGYSPATLGLVEAHGTGTVAGDRAEMETVSRLMAAADAPAGGCAVGSVKTMIGHTKAAAGVSGLIKAALALHHRVLPPHLGLQRPQGILRDTDSPLFACAETQPWVRHPQHPRRAGVSAFGFGGTNYHVTLEEYRDEYRPWERPALVDDWPAELLLFTAEGRDGLVEQLTAVRDALAAGATPRLLDLAATLAAGVDPEAPERLAIVCRSPAELPGQLEAALAQLNTPEQPLVPGIHYSPAPLLREGKLALLFPGQGSQYPGMLRELACLFPELLAVLERADEVLYERIQASCGPGRRLSSLIHPPNRFELEQEQRARAELTRTEVAQPALGAVSAGLWALLERFGLEPAMAAGHSYGEYVALHAAGVLALDDLLRLSEARGRYIVEEAAASDLGTMLAVKADWQVAETVVSALEGVVMANHNSPSQVVLSGTREAIAAAAERLAAEGIDSTPLPVAAAFHSPLVEPAKTRLADQIEATPFGAAGFPVFSNTSAAKHDERHPDVVRSALAEHLVSPVRFVDEVRAMYDAGARLFLEVGPRPVLARLTARILDDRPHRAVAVDDNGGGVTGLLHALGTVFAEGGALQAEKLFEGRAARRLRLERLVEETRPAAPASQVWLVNGTHARRPGEVGGTGSRPTLRLEEIQRLPAPLVGQLLTASEDAPFAEEYPMTEKRQGSAPPPRGSADEVMAAYQETMRQFLALQDRVMTSYFQGGGSVPQLATTPPAPMATAAATAVAERPAAAAAVPVAEPVAAPAPATPAAAPAPAPAVAAPEAVDIKALLLGVVSERTGYPEEMLGLDQDIEADLGIDSIKRVEILGAFQKALPAATGQALQGRMESVSALRTLQAIIDAVEGAAPADGAGEKSEAAEGTRPFESTGVGSAVCAPLPRYVMRAHAEPLEGVAIPPLPAGIYLATDDGTGIADALAPRLPEGASLVLIPEALLHDLDGFTAWLDGQRRQGPIRALLHLLPLGGEPMGEEMDLSRWRARIAHEVKPLFALLKPLAGDLQEGGRLLCASAMGGQFGRDYQPGRETFAFPGGAGLLGLVKSLSFEWNRDIYRPNFSAKALDLDPSQPAAAMAGQIHGELALFQGRREVGYPNGERTIFRTVPASVTPFGNGLPEPDGDWVILATGGARGITAECLREFMPYRPTVVLVGRSELPPEEPEATRGLEAIADLRGHFLGEAKASGDTVRPAELERRIRTLLRDREMLRNVADLTAAGMRVDYRVVDVRDEAAFGGLIDALYEQYGRIDAVLHGAGVIEDKLLADKPLESVARVLDTKLDSAFVLASRLRPASLRFLAFFTSVAGRYGNPGQTDYATANETINRLAWILRARWGGKVKVAALNWNPWGPTTHGAGMVTPEVRRQFEARGVMLVESAAGSRLLFNELRHADLSEAEVVAGDCPWEYDEARHGALPRPADPARVEMPSLALLDGARRRERGGAALVLSKAIDLVSDPYLDHHRIDGVPVMPFAGAVEYLAESAALAAGDRQVAAVTDIQLVRGLRLDAEAMPVSIRLTADGERLKGEIHRDDEGHIAYRGAVELAGRLPEPESYALPQDLADPTFTTDEAIRRWLFHGPMFQTITAVEGVDERGLLARLRPTRPAELYPPAKEAAWLFDPALVDGAIQTVLVWSRAVRNTTPLPTRLGRIARFGSEPLPEELWCHLQLVSDASDPTIHCHIALTDGDGRLRILLQDFEGAGSTAMNRVGGGWAGGEPEER